MTVGKIAEKNTLLQTVFLAILPTGICYITLLPSTTEIFVQIIEVPSIGGRLG